MYLRLLGTARLESGGAPVRGRAAHRRRLGILALLAATPPALGVKRERIIGLLWPESSPDAARRLLSESIYVLRKDLGENLILVSGDELALNHSELPSDLLEFRNAVASGDLEKAVSSYGGAFLDAWYVDDAPEFERWVERERESLAHAHRQCLERLAERAEASRDWPAAIRWWRELASVDRFSAPVVLRLAKAQVSAGQRATALQTLSAHEATLREEMELAPEPEVLAFAAQLRASSTGSSAVVPAAKPVLAVHGPPVVRALDGDAVQSMPVTPRRRRRRAVLAGVAAAAILIVVALSARSVGVRAGSRTFLPQFDPNEVAVRPFVDLTGRNSALALALTDELILRLTGVPPIRVASRNAVMRTRDSTIGIDSLARALRVGTIIEGTLRESAGRLSVVVLITDIASGKYVGATEVKSDSNGYFALVEDLASNVERDFRRRLGENFRLRELTSGTRSAEATRLMAEAQRAIDLGRETSREWRPDAVRVSRGYLLAADSVLQLAGAVDAHWAQPLIKRAFVASRLAGTDPPAQGVRTLDAGVGYLNEALRLDPASSAALEMRGTLQFQRHLTYASGDTSDRDLRLAIADYESAKSRDSLRIGAWIGRAYIAWFQLDTVAARKNIEGASRLDAYLDGETDILLNKFYVALWLRDWKAAGDACRTGRREDPWAFEFLQCELTLARHDTTRRASPKWAWAVVDTLSRMYPAQKAALASRQYIPIYWRVLAATISARSGQVREARAEMDSAVMRAKRNGVETDLEPDRAYFEWTYGDPKTAVALMTDYFRQRKQQRANMAADALLAPVVARVRSE